MKVLITTAYPDLEPISTLRELAAKDRFGVHTLVEDPEAAELILFAENSHYEDDPFFRTLRRHPWVREYREKAFMYNEHDRPYCVLPGLYSSMPAPYFDPTRQRAWGYMYTRNPYLESVARAVKNPDLLFSFVGRRNAAVRSRVFELSDPDAVLQDDSHFDAYRQRVNEGNTPLRYAEVLGRSRFVLCPRGIGTGTNRLQEIMQSGRVPVILADDWVAPEGPEWDRFSVRVRETEVHRIPGMLRELDGRWEEMAREARRNWEEWFAPEVTFHRMVETCADIFRTRRLPEAVAQRYPRPLPLYAKYRARALLRPVRALARKVARAVSSSGAAS